MKFVKRFAAIALCVAMMAGLLVGCHQKDAVVATFTSDNKTYSVSSGVYMFMVIIADSEARQIVDTELSEAGESTDDVNYIKQTCEGKKYTEWVSDRVDEICRGYFIIQRDFDKYNLEIDEETEANKDSYLTYQWSYSYQYICEPNGVSYDSFEQFETVYYYQRSVLFEYLYSEGGPNGLSSETILEGLTDNFVIADLIQIDYTDDMEDEDIDAAKTKIQGYADRLNAGAEFSEIYDEYTAEQETEEDTDTSEDTESSDTTEESTEDTGNEITEEVLEPIDSLATLMGGEDTSAANDLYDDVKDLEVGVATVLSTDDYCAVVVKKDISIDPYYIENYREEVRYLLKDDEFTEYLTDADKELSVEYDSYEQDYLSPKKIDYTEYDNYIASMYSYQY